MVLMIGTTVEGPECVLEDPLGDLATLCSRVLVRGAEVDSLVGDPAKARTQLGWHCRTSFKELVREMVASDLQAAERDHLIRTNGYRVHEYHD